MRLHRLEITAFGPFAEHQQIDFDELSGAGLFLLHGPTGAGKTSVLDALCFALYGRVPGSRGASGRYRSDHADPAVRAEVVCEFTVAGRRLEVTRSPEWQRPKKRGTGFTREQAHVVVREWVADGWVGRTNRMDEAGDLIGQLIGLGPEQFTKLILLPQGEFAAFLRASAEERRPLLQKLFGTDRFAAVESWLGERRREGAGSVAAARAGTARLFARAQEARPDQPGQSDQSDQPDQGPGSGHEDLDLDDTEAVTALVREWATQAHAQLRAAHTAAVKAEAAHEKARAEHESVAETVRLRDRRRELVAEHGLLVSQSPEQAVRKARLQAAGHAPVLLPLLAELDAASVEVETAEFRVESARRRLADHGLEGQVDDGGGRTSPGHPHQAEPADQAEPARLRQELTRLRQELAALTALLPADLELRRLDRQALATQEQLQQTEAARVQAEKAAARLNEQAEKLLAARGESEMLASAAEDRHRDLERAKRVAEAVLRAQRLTEEQTSLEDTLRAVTDVHQAAVAAQQELQARRLAGMAAELAAGLGRDEECPVCGSLDHPRRAKHRARPVTEEEQERAAHQEAQTSARREQARQAVEAGRRQLAALTALTGGADAEAAMAELAGAQSRLSEANRAAASAQKLNAEVAGLAARLEAARARLEAATDAASAGREALAALESRRSDLRGRLDQARGDSADVQSRHARVTAAVEALTEHEEAHRALQIARDRLARARGAADNAATAAGFTDREAAAAAALPEADRAELAQVIADHDAQRARVEALLEELGREEQASAAARRAKEKQAARKPRRKKPRKADPGQPMLDLWAELVPIAPEPGPATQEPTTAAGTDGTDGPTDVLSSSTPEETEPDLDSLAEALNEILQKARTAHQSAQQRHTLLTRAAQALTNLTIELEQHAKQTADLRASFATLDAVSRCIEGTGGDNQLRMRLSSYVLAARLEQVAQAATLRLAAMSGGRYSLVHTDGPSRGGARSGLGLAVIDGWTGVQRDPSTLSGGETFCTSLALALGLADVVQAEAGGATIETLLVDEGFGSLDQDTLDEVMDVLDGLRSGGRAVGLVSHVADLRDRIPAQLEVVKGRDGSHLRVGAAALIA
ncbi:hypothetical protein Kisp01_54890 [Kineosporia sp. NBRC 101677]|uniref:AAA family ATPase n=1 Tax=Kineosporia sp. NBRC 101677 TaxID=3032197 RepID=UPI0024A0B51C|nr:SMC family ATPase [Kineosporia sp. NBRC 101677]GLY18475.1 hypothetical protein Kisp01_54890 [Kineosporia sp. NBRC 101677]